MIIGVLGGGQLGRMLALAGIPLGLEFRFLDPSKDAPAQEVGELLVGAYDDPEMLKRLAHGAQVVTFEFENVPAGALDVLASMATHYPSKKALSTAQDRFEEKTLFKSLQIPTTEFHAINTLEDLKQTLGTGVSLPRILKTRRLGYDGKGQFILRHTDDAEAAWKACAASSSILESYISFEREAALICVAGKNKETRFYPLVETTHVQGILSHSFVPSQHLTQTLQGKAETYAKRILDALDYVGVLAIEFFVSQGELIANEIAPRVHNSGHWSIEGARTSQFQNHLHAILGLPLGSTEVSQECALCNLIGGVPPLERLLEIPAAHVHLYGKEPRPKRKVGHVTLTNSSVFKSDFEKLRALVEQYRIL